MPESNLVRDLLLFVGHEQIRDGLFEDALDTFSAAHMLDASDNLALDGRELAHARLQTAGGSPSAA